MSGSAGRGPQGPEPVPVGDLSYTEASRELDTIVEFFERREVDVDQLVARLERATAIVDELDRRIRQTRMQVEELAPRLEAAARTAPQGAGSGTAIPGDDADEDLDEEELDENGEDEEDDALKDFSEQASETDRPLF